MEYEKEIKRVATFGSVSLHCSMRLCSSGGGIAAERKLARGMN